MFQHLNIKFYTKKKKQKEFIKDIILGSFIEHVVINVQIRSSHRTVIKEMQRKETYKLNPMRCEDMQNKDSSSSSGRRIEERG